VQKFRSFFSIGLFGKINLSGTVGDAVQADFVQLHIKPANRSVTVDGYENCSEVTDNITICACDFCCMWQIVWQSWFNSYSWCNWTVESFNSYSV